MKVLALEPWLGGSHSEWLESWRSASRHDVHVLGLPARHAKWRLGSAGVVLAEQARALEGQGFEALWVSDFVDLAQLRAWLPSGLAQLPVLMYMHENELTYPRSPSDPFAADLGPAWHQLLSLPLARRVLFNSHYHRDEYLAAVRDWLPRLPKPRPAVDMVAPIEAAGVLYLGVDLPAIPLGTGATPGSPLRIAFPHRWEYDKDPLSFLQMMSRLFEQGLAFELVLLGEFADRPPAECNDLLARLTSRIVHRGWLPSRAAYAEMLGSCDVVVSTARHEFYGLAMLEAVAAGCLPLAPHRLAYPELLPTKDMPLHAGVQELQQQIRMLVLDPSPARTGRGMRRAAIEAQDRRRAIEAMDGEISRLE
ncbi:MAG: DUF3524 domain-containing protein [Planctomycetota bacterium]